MPGPSCHPDRPLFSKGLCRACYAYQWRRRHGSPSQRKGSVRTRRVCPVDGVSFLANIGNLYCSTKCKERAAPARLCADCGVRLPNRRAKRCLECRIGRTRYDYVGNKRVVFDRDGWVCHLCRKRVPKDKAYPHPLSASIDHLIPIIAGGANTLDNLQTAHLRCNQKRKDGGTVQLRLVA